MQIPSEVNQRGDIELINGIDRTDPSYWRTTNVTEFQLDLNSMEFLEKGAAKNKYNISKEQVVNGVATLTNSIEYIHDGDEFVWVEVDNQRIAIRWNFVEATRLI